jgi:hypothetical protein
VSKAAAEPPPLLPPTRSAAPTATQCPACSAHHRAASEQLRGCERPVFRRRGRTGPVGYGCRSRRALRCGPAWPGSAPGSAPGSRPAQPQRGALSRRHPEIAATSADRRHRRRALDAGPRRSHSGARGIAVATCGRRGSLGAVSLAERAPRRGSAGRIEGRPGETDRHEIGPGMAATAAAFSIRRREQCRSCFGLCSGFALVAVQKWRRLTAIWGFCSVYC